MNINFETFVRTRHAMWLQKTCDIPIETYLEDLTAYELMRGHRYTNVWRELDRGTLVMSELQEKYLAISTTAVAVYHTLLYRFFNSQSGYHRFLVTAIAADELVTEPSADTINAVLDQTGNFSGAYIRTVQRSTAIKALQSLYGHAENIAVQLEAHQAIVKDAYPSAEITAILQNLREEMRAEFGRIPSFGNFLADQLMLDFCGQGNKWGLSFTPGLGPGAKRGLERTGMTFADAIDAGQQALVGMPVPLIKSSTFAPEHAVTFGAVEAEHQMCEYEKLLKILDAVAEGNNRQVKMRKYADATKAPMSSKLPDNWIMR